jgi:hypothetical protein
MMPTIGNSTARSPKLVTAMRSAAIRRYRQASVSSIVPIGRVALHHRAYYAGEIRLRAMGGEHGNLAATLRRMAFI